MQDERTPAHSSVQESDSSSRPGAFSQNPGARYVTGRFVGAPSGPLSQSCAAETLGMPQSWPFQPSNPSILNAQKPLAASLATMRPSALRTSIPQLPFVMPPPEPDA